MIFIELLVLTFLFHTDIQIAYAKNKETKQKVN